MPKDNDVRDESKEIGKRIKELNRTLSKKERWIITRMWTSTVLSHFFPDRNKIPDNIGNSILVGNNQVVTKNSMTAYILIKDFSAKTPIGFIGDLQHAVQSATEGDKVRVDIMIRNQKYSPDLSASGMKSRLSQWRRTMDNPAALERTKLRTARLLYTYDVCKKREPMFMSRFAIAIRAHDGRSLRTATKEVEAYLNSKNIEYFKVKDSIKKYMRYFTMLSHQTFLEVRDMPYAVMSMKTLAELLPQTKGWNDAIGSFFGIDYEHKGPYLINLRKSGKAKNIYVAGESGHGKTFLTIAWAIDAMSIGYRGCFMDLKGTEFLPLTKAFGGISLNMTASSTQYLNVFKLVPDGIKTRQEARTYFNSRMNLVKEFLNNIISYSEEDEEVGSLLINDFVKTMYLERGIASNNTNTWVRSKKITPYSVWTDFDRYYSEDLKEVYGDVGEYTRNRLEMYLSENSDFSHLWESEYTIEDVYDAPCLHFNFGILAGARNIDPAIFKVKLMFMRLLKDDYVAHNKSLGEWTWTVLEEAQIATDYVKRIYVEDITLRRAQNQVTCILGNSVSAMKEDKVYGPILDNINIFCLGVLNKTSREYMIEQFGLEDRRKTLEDIAAKSPEYENTFLFVNRFQNNAPVGVIKAMVPDRVRDGKLFKNVDTKEG